MGGEPLAVVGSDGKIREATCGPERSAARGNRQGDEWVHLDVWGRAIETVKVATSFVYDLTSCREIELTGPEDGIGKPTLYVRGSRPPAKSRAFPCASEKPDPALIASFRAATGLRSAPVFFCPTNAASQKTTYAIAGGRGLVIARYESARWTIVHRVTQTPRERPANPDEAFIIVSILDMNGDGAPEIVVHARSVDVYDDDIYTLGPDGRVQLVVTRRCGYV